MGSNRNWRRLATLRAARRRTTELPPPARTPQEAEPLPPLVPPDDDREFLPHPYARPEPSTA
jgi:hypothetical protein